MAGMTAATQLRKALDAGMEAAMHLINVADACEHPNSQPISLNEAAGLLGRAYAARHELQIANGAADETVALLVQQYQLAQDEEHHA